MSEMIRWGYYLYLLALLIMCMTASEAFRPVSSIGKHKLTASGAQHGIMVGVGRVGESRWIIREASSTGLYAKARGGGKKTGGGPGPKKKVKDDVIQVDGRVVESLPNAMFKVEIEPSGNMITATISGKIRKNFVRIVVGDKVVVELSAYDLTKGRITYRNK